MRGLKILRGHEKDLGGGFRVLRVLPAATQRSVGPFVFFDHFGPLQSLGERAHDVRPHPHIGLATVTYLFDGSMQHHDSTGANQTIEPGAVNWMTAGRGIVHSERAPESRRGKPTTMHGLQLWVALPKAHEEAEPSFSHTAAQDIPQWEGDGATVRVLVGSALGLQSPVPTLMPTLYLDIRLAPGAEIAVENWADEMALYAPETPFVVGAEGTNVGPRDMVVLDGATQVRAPADAGSPTRIVLIGGAKLDGPRFMWWNFVSSRKERIHQAAEDWASGRFPAVEGETEFIPLPEQRLE